MSAISGFHRGLSSATSDFSDTEDNTDSSYSRLTFAPGGYAGEKAGVGGGMFKGTFDTYKLVTGNKMLQGNAASSPVPLGAPFNPGQGSSLENSLADKEPIFGSCHVSASPAVLGGVVSVTSNTISSSSISHPQIGAFPFGPVKTDGEVAVKTVGELRVPKIDSMDALASPLGSVPGLNLGTAPGAMGLGPNDPGVPGFDPHRCGPMGSVPDHPSFGGSMQLGTVPLGSTPGSLAMQPGPGLISGSGSTSGPLGSVPFTGAAASSLPGFSDAPSGSLTLPKHPEGEELGDRKNVVNVADGSSDAGGDVQFDIGTDDLDGEFIGGDLKGTSALSSGETSEIERALQKLTPEEVDRRRKMLGRTYR